MHRSGCDQYLTIFELTGICKGISLNLQLLKCPQGGLGAYTELTTITVLLKMAIQHLGWQQQFVILLLLNINLAPGDVST